MGAPFGADRQGILRLLDCKIAAAKADLQADLQAQLYGRKPEKNVLRQAIADAYDETTFNNAMSATLDIYKDQITENIFSENVWLKHIKKERAVSDNRAIAEDAVAERKKARAKERVDILGNFFDDVGWEDGNQFAWSCTFDSNAAKTYHYVAVRGGIHWFITGDPVKYTTDDLIVKLVTLAAEGAVDIDGWDDPL